MKKKMYMKILWLSLLCILLLTGCGGEDGSAAGGSDAAVNGGVTGSESAAGNSDGAVNSSDAGGSGSASSLWVTTMESVSFEGPEAGYQEGTFSYATLGNRIYLMRAEYPEDGGAAQLSVQVYDCDTKEIEKTAFSLEIPDHEAGMIISIDLTTKRELSLKLKKPGSENDYFLVKTDLQGTVLEVEETFPDAEGYPWNQDHLSMTRAFPLADGSVILSRWNDGNQVSVLTRFDEETGETKPLGTFDGGFMNAVCCDGDGILYYYSSTCSIIRWDVEKDIKEELTAPLYQEGIDISGTAGLIWNAKGDLLLCDLGRDKASLYVLTKEKPVSEEEIRLACVQDPVGNVYLREMAAVFSRENSEIPIVMEGLNESDYTDYRNRIVADLVAGKGPEILLLSYEDLEILQDKGLLCDLSEMISDDTLSQMIPGALELGRVNGCLAGITPEVAFSTLITADTTWEADSWTISQFTELLKGEDLDWPVSFYDERVSYYTLFWMIFCNDLSQSPFLDLEEGKCYFDSREFIDILNLCKKYGQPSSETRSQEERSRMLREGESLAAINFIYTGFRGFSNMMLSCGEDCHIVGFPGEDGSHSFIQNYSQGYLAVNINAEHKEEIKEFLNYLLSYEKQYEVMGASVRLDVIRDSIQYDSYNERFEQRVSADPYGPTMEIPLKPDGTSFLEEYLEFVQNCEPNPNRISQLSEIIGDELLGCFEGGKSVEDAAAAIQNRIQLYLDETAR